MTKLPEDDAEAVLSLIEESGVFDELRGQLISKIRQNVRSDSPCSHFTECFRLIEELTHIILHA